MLCRYDYILNDYQGNVRAVISQNGVLEEVNGYYPYGGITGAPATGVQARKYGGKELDRENGLDWLDSHARMYDPLIGRTPTMDPMSEKYYHLSPHLWCAGNPVKFIDKSGKYIMISGKNGGIAYNAISDYTSDNLKILNFYGLIFFAGVPVSDAEKIISEASYSPEILVILNCSDDVPSGSYRGSEFGSGGIVIGTQNINPDNLNIIDAFYNMPKGTSIAHELIEAIIGTIYHPGEKATDQSVNIGEEICSDDQNYLDAHDKAKYLDPYFKEPNIIYDEKSKTYYITDGEREEKLK